MDNNESPVAQDAVVVREGRFFAIIGYFSFLCFVPLYFKRSNSFAVFHGKQALVIFILELAACILKVVPLLGAFVASLALVALGLLSLFAIYKVFVGECWRIPYIADVAETIDL